MSRCLHESEIVGIRHFITINPESRHIDAAFRLFILMASRRLKSDRFLSKDYRPEIYTKEGFKWVEETSMIDLLRRHFPALAPALKDVETAFHPWKKPHAPFAPAHRRWDSLVPCPAAPALLTMD